MKVPKKNRWVVLPAMAEPTQNRASEPSAPPSAIIKYFCKATSVFQHKGHRGSTGTPNSPARTRLIQPSARKPAHRGCVTALGRWPQLRLCSELTDIT